MNTQINPIANIQTVLLNGSWDFAIDCVTYPVYLKPLHYHHNGEEHPAEGVTNTLRESKFFGVVVDRDRCDSLETIAVVTGLYDTISAPEVYETLRDDLAKENVQCSPERLYVSGNGGKQELMIKLDGLSWCDTTSDVHMYLKMITSVDGTTKHTIRIAPIDAETGAELIGVESVSMSLSARHTKNIREHHAAFGVIIENLIKEWDDVIIPTMQMMNDCKFDKAMAIAIIEGILEEADVPERHAQKALLHYEGLGRSEHTMLGVSVAIGSYFSEELANKPERLSQYQERITKRSKRVIQKYLDRL